MIGWVANPEVYEFLEAERIKYAIRLPANASEASSLRETNAFFCVMMPRFLVDKETYPWQVPGKD